MNDVPKGLINLIENVLAIQTQDKVAVIFDLWGSEVANYLKNILINNHTTLQEVSQYTSYYLPKKLKELLLDDQHNVCILCLKKNIWHTPERKMAKYKLKKRLCWVIGSVDYLQKESSICSYENIKALGKEIFRNFRRGREIFIKSSSGTNLTATIGEAFLEDGFYDVPGTGGDFPAGEVGFGPIEGSVKGKICYDLKVYGLGSVKPHDIQVRIKDDEIVSIEGRRANELKTLVESFNISTRFIGEISVGLNPYVILKPNPEVIIEEKMLGTIHFGHGGNLSFGNRIGGHFDAVISKPTISVGNLTLLQKGKINQKIISKDVIKWLNSVEK